jgi:hypothetical protein
MRVVRTAVMTRLIVNYRARLLFTRRSPIDFFPAIYFERPPPTECTKYVQYEMNKYPLLPVFPQSQNCALVLIIRLNK